MSVTGQGFSIGSGLEQAFLLAFFLLQRVGKTYSLCLIGFETWSQSNVLSSKLSAKARTTGAWEKLISEQQRKWSLNVERDQLEYTPHLSLPVLLQSGLKRC